MRPTSIHSAGHPLRTPIAHGPHTAAEVQTHLKAVAKDVMGLARLPATDPSRPRPYAALTSVFVRTIGGKSTFVITVRKDRLSPSQRDPKRLEADLKTRIAGFQVARGMQVPVKVSLVTASALTITPRA